MEKTTINRRGLTLLPALPSFHPDTILSPYFQYQISYELSTLLYLCMNRIANKATAMDADPKGLPNLPVLALNTILKLCAVDVYKPRTGVVSSDDILKPSEPLASSKELIDWYARIDEESTALVSKRHSNGWLNTAKALIQTISYTLK